MAILKTDNYHVHYEIDGPANAPVLVLSNSLGTTLDMWVPQIDALRWKFRVLRYDTRGHGGTSVIPGPYTIGELGQDVLAMLDELDIERVHFCGISMGGLIGQWLGINAPERINRLIVSNTAARIGTAEGWQARAHLVRTEGMAEVADGAASRWFTPSFIQRQPERVEILLRQLRSSPQAGYAACCDALEKADLREDIQRIQAPLLAIAGRHDPVTTPADARFIAERVTDGRYVELDASHLSNVEASDAFTKAVLEFLTA